MATPKLTTQTNPNRSNEPYQNHKAQTNAQYNNNCLLYTSDAADEEDSVDLGGRRIIKKKLLLTHHVGYKAQN